MILGSSLSVGVQTAARGAVCVFAGCVRSSQEGGSKSVLADSTVARGGSSKRQGNSPRSSCRQDQFYKQIMRYLPPQADKKNVTFSGTTPLFLISSKVLKAYSAAFVKWLNGHCIGKTSPHLPPERVNFFCKDNIKLKTVERTVALSFNSRIKRQHSLLASPTGIWRKHGTTSNFILITIHIKHLQEDLFALF